MKLLFVTLIATATLFAGSGHRWIELIPTNTEYSRGFSQGSCSVFVRKDGGGLHLVAFATSGTIMREEIDISSVIPNFFRADHVFFLPDGGVLQEPWSRHRSIDLFGPQCGRMARRLSKDVKRLFLGAYGIRG